MINENYWTMLWCSIVLMCCEKSKSVATEINFEWNKEDPYNDNNWGGPYCTTALHLLQLTSLKWKLLYWAKIVILHKKVTLMNSVPHLLTQESEIIFKKDELDISCSCGTVSLSLFILQNKEYPWDGMTTGPNILRVWPPFCEPRPCAS